MRKFLLPKTLLCFLIAFSFLTSKAEIKVSDAETGQPLAKASIFDKNGIFIAVADEEGILPANIKLDSYPLNIRYVGYLPADIDSPEISEVKMEESIYTLPEVTIDDVSRNLLYIQAYVRNYLTQNSEKDTVVSFEEQIVDFVFPITKKAKFKGWKKARVLAQRSYDKAKNSKKDSVRYKEGNDGYSNSFNLTDKFVLPDAIAAGNAIKDKVEGKYSTKEMWRKVGDNYFLIKDDLADYKDHICAPALAKVLGMSMKLDKDEYNFKFEDKGKSQFSPEDILEASFNYNLIMDGKLTKYAFETKDPVVLNSYGELFVIDRAYLTADEAKELKKDVPVVIASEFKAPENIPLPPAEMMKLKERVIKENSLNKK